MLQTKKELDEKGYVTKPRPMIDALLRQIKDESIRNFAQSKTSELSDSLDKFKVGYDYKIINPRFYDKHWGYSPMGGYDHCYEGECREGWSGVVEYFEKDDLTCAYSEHNTKIAHGGNELIEELITYNINNKPTIELITKDSGPYNAGYSYELHWFQKDYDRTLECASKTYSINTMNKVKSWAAELDKR